MLSLYYYELMGKIKEHGGKKYLYTTLKKYKFFDKQPFLFNSV